MARIRTVKPEFWTDGKILRLSDATALFFIALWNFADDYGFFELDPLQLSMKTGRWRSQDMMKMCSALEERGLVRCSRGDGVGMIVGWEHQKIRDRRASKWNQMEILWDEVKNDAPRSDKNALGKDRIGKDRIGTPTVPLKGDGVSAGIKNNIPIQSDYDQLVQIWNETVKNLPKVKNISKARIKKISARLAECKDFELWKSAMKMLDRSDWSNGKSERGWVADFDYLIRPEKFLGLIEKAQQVKQSKPKEKTAFEIPEGFLKS